MNQQTKRTDALLPLPDCDIFCNMSKKIVSLIVPCYNEEQSVAAFYAAIKAVFEKASDEDFELLFIDDGSSDNTYTNISALHQKDNRVKCLSFSRNFGKEAALFSGIRAVTGDCAVIMDADLQHPPETILDMIQCWKDGYDVVEGIKTSRGRESLLHKAFSGVFYKLMSAAIGMDMENSSDFKLLDRKAVNELAKLKERNTFFRALSFWVGFKKTTVYYEVQERLSGTSKWSFKSLLKYALQNVISFTDVPLQLITVIGFLFLVIGCGVGIDALISFLRGKAESGYPSLVFLILLSTGGIMFSLGIVGTYIAKIYDEIKARPQYIVDKKIE